MSAQDDLGFWLRHTVTVATYEGEGAYGPVWGDPATVQCWVDENRRSVRTAEGDEVVSEATIFAELSAADVFAPESRVTLWEGLTGQRTAQVIAVKRRDSAGIGLPDHVEVSVT